MPMSTTAWEIRLDNRAEVRLELPVRVCREMRFSFTKIQLGHKPNVSFGLADGWTSMISAKHKVEISNVTLAIPDCRIGISETPLYGRSREA